MLHHCFIEKPASSIASCFWLFLYRKSKCPKNVLLSENVNAKEGRNCKEASDLQLGLIFQLILGLLKIHSSQSNPQQAVLTIPSQLKPLSVNTSGGVQTILMPVNKGESFTYWVWLSLSLSGGKVCSPSFSGHSCLVQPALELSPYSLAPALGLKVKPK